jgi:hypothetical protein
MFYSCLLQFHRPGWLRKYAQERPSVNVVLAAYVPPRSYGIIGVSLSILLCHAKWFRLPCRLQINMDLELDIVAFLGAETTLKNS